MTFDFCDMSKVPNSSRVVAVRNTRPTGETQQTWADAAPPGVAVQVKVCRQQSFLRISSQRCSGGDADIQEAL